MTICQIKAATTERNKICQNDATSPGVTTPNEPDGSYGELAMCWNIKN